MDPLSIAGSIVGIIAAAAKVMEMVQPFASNIKDAPNLAVTVHNEVNCARIVLASPKAILKDLPTPAYSAARASFIQVEHLVVILFSELETLLASLKVPHNGNA